MCIQSDWWSVVPLWRHVGRLSSFEVGTHVRLQHLYNDTGHEHKVGSWSHDCRRLSTVAGCRGAEANFCDAPQENLEPTAIRIDQRPKGIMGISSDAIS